MKKFFSLIAALFALATFSVSAQNITTITNGVNLITTNVNFATQFIFQDTSGANNTVILYDNNSASSTNIAIPGYVTANQILTNVISSWTNVYGVVQSYTNLVLQYSYTTNAATTNEASRKWQFFVPAYGSLVYQGVPIPFTYGLQVKATGSGFLNYQIK
jgi:hypothetical protein